MMHSRQHPRKEQEASAACEQRPAEASDDNCLFTVHDWLAVDQREQNREASEIKGADAHAARPSCPAIGGANTSGRSS